MELDRCNGKYRHRGVGPWSERGTMVSIGTEGWDRGVREVQW